MTSAIDAPATSFRWSSMIINSHTRGVICPGLQWGGGVVWSTQKSMCRFNPEAQVESPVRHPHMCQQRGLFRLHIKVRTLRGRRGRKRRLNRLSLTTKYLMLRVLDCLLTASREANRWSLRCAPAIYGSCDRPRDMNSRRMVDINSWCL